MTSDFFRSSAAACAAACAISLSGVASAQPNIVFIISDDAGWADFGFNDQGNGEVPTPALDSIADRGRWFRAAYTAPVCSPSRARIFLGQHNQRTGYDNNNPDSQNAADGVVEGITLDDVTLFERMNDAGYHVGYFGKWHLGTELDVVQGGVVTQEGNLPPRHGIDYFWGLTSGSRSYFMGAESNYQKVIREMTLDPMTNLITDTNLESTYPANDYLTDVLADEVAEYITDRHQSPDPFFAVASFTAPHGPLQATAEYFARADALGLGLTGNRRTYTAMMIAFDDGVQTILDRLEDPNNDGDTSDSIVGDTLICFINDNGGETANTARNFPLRGKKSDTFDGGVRVMMTLAGPGIPTTGASFDFPVDSVDLTPTFLAAAGMPLGPTDFTDGVNLLPYLDGTLSGAPRDSIYVRGNNPIVAGARQGDFKLTIENIGGPFLYDIVANPDETNVLNNTFPGVVDDLTDLMTGFEAEYQKPRWGATDVNAFDGFVYRAASVGSANWSTANTWAAEGGSPPTATMFERDGYANHTARFPANATPYTATNDLSRPNGLTLLTNGLFFDGAHAGASDSGVVITGRGLVLTDSLDGVLPEIAMDLSSTGLGAHPVRIETELRLWDDLGLTGAGNELLTIAGTVVSERSGVGMTKTSSGALAIEGDVDLSGSFALLNGETQIIADGRVAAGPLRVEEGAALIVGDGDASMTPDFLGNLGVLDVDTPTTGGPPISLHFEGLDVIGGLVIDGQLLPLGVYGPATHPAIFQGNGDLIIRGPLFCDGDVNDDGFADFRDTLAFLRTFDADQGCGGASAALPTGITVNCDATADTPGDGIWDVTAPGTDISRAWTFAGNVSPIATDASAPTPLTLAYEFPEAQATGPDYEDPSRSPSTIELWFRPDDFAGDQIIWEAGGGGRGAAIWLSGNELRLDVRNGTPAPLRTTATLTAGWTQVVAVIDISNSISQLYVNGQFESSVNLGSTDRWAGGNPAGLGQVASTAVGNITPPDFRGQIGIYRAYNNRALPAADVLDAYNAVISAAQPCDPRSDLNGDGSLTSADVGLHLDAVLNCAP